MAQVQKTARSKDREEDSRKTGDRDGDGHGDFRGGLSYKTWRKVGNSSAGKGLKCKQMQIG